MQSCLPELFCILRYCNLDCTEMDSLIQWGLTTGDPAVLRHCLGMILSLSEKSPERAAALLKPCLADPSAIENGVSLASLLRALHDEQGPAVPADALSLHQRQRGVQQSPSDGAPLAASLRRALAPERRGRRRRRR